MGRGFDEHVGYYQGCGSAYTHIAACCTAGSDTHDQDFVCEPGGWSNKSQTAPKDFRGYDWFASGPAPNKVRTAGRWSAHFLSSNCSSQNHWFDQCTTRRTAVIAMMIISGCLDPRLQQEPLKFGNADQGGSHRLPWTVGKKT